VTLRLLTIGGYGFDEHSFMEALQNAEVDTFIDVRQRRGLRGSQYAFLNSARLQDSLRRTGIRYIHIRELAPTTRIRELQRVYDSDEAVAKRQRIRLSPLFVEAYRREVLVPFTTSSFEATIGPTSNAVVLFCVEMEPGACHRSLAAEHLAPAGTTVEHLMP